MKRLVEVGVASNIKAAKARNWKDILINWTIAQGAVTTLCIPLLLFFFQKFSLVSPLANAVAIPVVSFIITPLALLFAVFPYTWLIQLDHWLLVQLMSVISFLADWPIWEQPAPPILTVLIALVGIIWIWMPKGFPSKFIGIFLILPAYSGIRRGLPFMKSGLMFWMWDKDYQWP